MFLGEVIDLLEGEGISVTPTRIRRAMLLGRVSRPAMDAVGNLLYERSHVDQIRKYVKHPPRPGRRPRAERAAAAGV